MTTFVDGPAKGQMLMLRRAPIVLRVVCSARFNWDALDQVGDAPKPQETVYVYILTRPPSCMFIRAHARACSGRYAQAEYRLLEDPPAEEYTRDTELWNAWCAANQQRLTPAWAKQGAES